MIGVVGALGREVAGLLRHLDGGRRARLGRGQAHAGTLLGKPLVVAVTGMGARCASDGARALLAGYPLTALLSVGFAGALVEGLPAASLVLPERLFLEGSPAVPVAADASMRRRLLDAAHDAGLAVRSEPSVTAPQMVTARRRRAALAAASGAAVVDMEGYWLAREAWAAGVPFVSVRAVSDAVRDEHPVLAGALAGGGMSVPRLLLGYAANPREAAKLPRLASDARAAAAALTRCALVAVRAISGETPT